METKVCESGEKPSPRRWRVTPLPPGSPPSPSSLSIRFPSFGQSRARGVLLPESLPHPFVPMHRLATLGRRAFPPTFSSRVFFPAARVGRRLTSGAPSPTPLPGGGGDSMKVLTRTGLLLLAALPTSALLLVVHGTSYGKIYRPSDAGDFLLKVVSGLEPRQMAELREEVLRVIEERHALLRYNFNPGKAGSAVSYTALQTHSPALCAFYEGLAGRVSDVLGQAVRPTPLTDKSSLSLLVYSAPGDHIDWHYDLNFYKGRHFTVLVPIIVAGPVDAQLQAVVPESAGPIALPPRPTPQTVAAETTGAGAGAGAASVPIVRHASASQETVAAILGGGYVGESGNAFPGAAVQAVPVEVGNIIVFEGAKVFHRVTPLGGSVKPWESSWRPPPPPPVAPWRVWRGSWQRAPPCGSCSA